MSFRVKIDQVINDIAVKTKKEFERKHHIVIALFFY